MAKETEPDSQTKEQRLLTLLQNISLAVEQAKTTNNAFSQVLGHICRFMDWPLGHVYVWSEEANTLVSSKIWHMDDAASMAPFRALSEATRFRRGEGTVGNVWQTGNPTIILNVQKSAEFVRRLPTDTGIRAYFAFPVMLEANVLAVLEFFSLKSVPPSQDMTSIINHVSALLGLTMQRQQTINRLQQSEAELAQTVDKLSALMEIGQAISETLELDDLLQLITEQTREILANANWVAIHLLQPKSNTLELVASASLDIDPDDYLIKSGEGIAGQVMAEGGILNIPDVQTDNRRLPIDLRANFRALLVAPVESRQRRIGVISVQCATPAAFTHDDERLLAILGVQAGMAIENARLFALQRRARVRAEKRRERMRQMARRVVEAQEEERSRIARELHDESGQSLTSLKISLDLIRAQLPDELSDIRNRLSDVLDLADKTMSNLRLLSHNLRPPGLDSYGLDAALDGLCQDYEAHTGHKVIYEGHPLPELTTLTALSLYRFTQEALTNVVKHAEATEIYVTLARESDMISLTVADNGQGFMPPDFEDGELLAGIGLAGMVERLEMVNGRLQINSTLGEGSEVTAVVPYTTKEQKAP